MPRRDIYIVNVHGTGLTNPTSPSRSPGQTGVSGDNLRCDWVAESQCYRLREQPSRRSGDTRLTDAPGSDTNPAWSPKGDRIAFESNRSGRPEMWVMNADGSEQERLTNFDADITPSNVDVSKATWSPRAIASHSIAA